MRTLILVLLEKILDLMLGKNERRSIQKNEETLLNKLFATIDAGNATNNTKA